MLNCPKCQKELEEIEERSILLYWGGEKYVYASPLDQCYPYCAECGAYLGDDPEVRAVMQTAQ